MDLGLHAPELAALVAQHAGLLGDPVAAERERGGDLSQLGERLQVRLRTRRRVRRLTLVARCTELRLAFRQDLDLFLLVPDGCLALHDCDLELSPFELLRLEQRFMSHLCADEQRSDLLARESETCQLDVRVRRREPEPIKETPGVAQAPAPVRRLRRKQRIQRRIGLQSSFEGMEHERLT